MIYSDRRRTCYPTQYPFNVFCYRELPLLEFAPITLLYGGNGSGKSTILNVMAENWGCSMALSITAAISLKIM